MQGVTRTLLSCALVSKSWSDPAISKLWSGHQAIVLQNTSKCDNEIVDRLAEISRNVRDRASYKLTIHSPRYSPV
jgi:hypothetical protein